MRMIRFRKAGIGSSFRPVVPHPFPDNTGFGIRPVPHIFLQEQLSLLIVEADLSNIVDHCFDLSVCDLSTEFMNGNFGVIPFRFPIQSPKLLGHLGHLGSPDSETVGSPGFHDHPLCIIAVMQGIVLYLKIP